MTVLLSPLPKLRFVDSNGNALTGGKLFTYTAGTTSKLATYTDSTGGTPNTNPILLDARGECNCWLTAGSAYKLVLSPSTDSDPPTNPIWTVDQITSQSITVPVSTANGGTGASTINAARQNLGLTFNKYVTAGTSTLTTANIGQLIAPSTTGVTLTLPPTAGLANGDTFGFEQPNSGDTLTINRNSSETIFGPGLNAGGVTSLSLKSQYDLVIIQFDGTNYKIVGGSQSFVGATGAYRSVALQAQNNGSTPNSKVDISAAEMTLRNPNDGSTVTLVNTSTSTNDITQAGPIANGRDQAGAFSNSTWVHFYSIWKPGLTTPDSLSSANAPSTGPAALPTGYTHWMYAGALFLNGSGNIVKTHIRGSWAYYDAFQTALSGGTASVETSINLANFIPPNALATKVGLHSANSGITGGGNDQAILRVVSGSDFDKLLFLSNTATGVDQNKTTECPPVTAQTIFYLISRASTGGSVSLDVLIIGYKLPNGGE